MEPININVVRHRWSGRPGISLLEISDDDLKKLISALSGDPRFRLTGDGLDISDDVVQVDRWWGLYDR